MLNKGIIVSEPILTGGFIALLKSLFPGAVGAATAIWYKSRDVDWKNLTPAQMCSVILLCAGMMVLGVSVSHYAGGALCEYMGIVQGSYNHDLIKGAVGLASLKIIDAFMSNVDAVIAKATDRIKDNVGGGK